MRYHVLPLFGLIAMVAALSRLVAPLTPVRDSARFACTRRGLRRPDIDVRAIAGIIFVELYAEPARPAGHPEGSTPPGRAVRDNGISRLQLIRIFEPVWRPWNESVLHDSPNAFHVMNLAVQMPENSERTVPDEEACALLVASLTPVERIALGAGTCASLAPVHPQTEAPTLAVARPVDLREVTEFKPGMYRSKFDGAYIEFEFGSAADARYVLLPGLAADQDMIVLLSDKRGRWRGGQNVRWLKSPSADASIDLQRLIHWSGRPLTGIRLQFTCPGELALKGAPCLLR